MRELNIQEVTTFPASPFALTAQLKSEISLGGVPPSKFTEYIFRPDLMSGQLAMNLDIRLEARAGRV